MRSVVLVPRRAGNPYRDSVWEWVSAWWDQHVGLPVYVGEHLDGPFNRSAALNAASALAGEWDVAILIDADVILDPRLVFATLAIASGTPGPALAYDERIHLDRHGTRLILDGFSGSWRPFTRTRLTDSCSSAIAVSRDLWETSGGFDEMFVGWGWEDVAFRCAVETFGLPLTKLQGTLWHLWHPKSTENDRSAPLCQANQARGALYKEARMNRPKMIALRDEHLAARLVST